MNKNNIEITLSSSKVWLDFNSYLKEHIWRSINNTLCLSYSRVKLDSILLDKVCEIIISNKGYVYSELVELNEVFIRVEFKDECGMYLEYFISRDSEQVDVKVRSVSIRDINSITNTPLLTTL